MSPKTVGILFLYIMYHRILPALFLLFVSLTTMSNRNGRAASQNSGNTGAPGDEMIAGAPRTCVNCHGGPAITASLNITVLQSNGQPVTSYVPGQSYTARVTITAAGTNLRGYGFQMIALRDGNNSDLDGFSDPSTGNNFKIATISNGRTYAEHAGISTSNTFEVPWKAPATGTGNITFYASGNGVNNNNGSSGDGAGVATLKMTEAGTTSADQPRHLPLKVSLSPNPLREGGTLVIENSDDTADIDVQRIDIQGRLTTVEHVKATDQTLRAVYLNSADWLPGLYWLRVSSGSFVRTISVLKL